MIKVKKGTVLYEIGEVADRGYILLSGCIQVLHKKNTREKTE
jgi:CRP-like cAMP-binding protein